MEYLHSLPALWAEAGPDGRQALATAIFARTDVTGFERLEYELTPDAIELGLDAALPAVFELSGTIGEFGRGERDSCEPLPNSAIAQLPDGQRHAAGTAGAPRPGPQRVTRRPSRSAGRATDREVVVVAAVLAAGSEKAAAHRLGLAHSTVKHHLANARSKVGATTAAQLVWILGPRLPEPEGGVHTDE